MEAEPPPPIPTPSSGTGRELPPGLGGSRVPVSRRSSAVTEDRGAANLRPDLLAFWQNRAAVPRDRPPLFGQGPLSPPVSLKTRRLPNKALQQPQQSVTRLRPTAIDVLSTCCGLDAVPGSMRRTAINITNAGGSLAKPGMAPPDGGGKRRQDIQGLRTIGALLVAVFHIWELGISGGVDVFFVVSGFFLGVGYLELARRQQPLRAADHVGRFVRRTVPQVLLVLSAILLLGLVFLGPIYWQRLMSDVAFSALFVQNYDLIRRSQNYLERGEAATLAQHFWAVSVIAQATVAWLPLTRLAETLERMSKGRRSRLWCLKMLLVVLVLLSLAWSVISTTKKPAAAYFDLLARYWEFGVGALLGLSIAGGRRRAVSARLADALSWAGLVLLLACGPLIGAQAAFPGYAALWPVAAAVLILAFSQEAQAANAGRLLAWRPLAGLGSYAFGIYLWHWPLYLLLLRTTGEKPTPAAGLAIIGASVVLAWISQKLSDRLATALWDRFRPKTASIGLAGGLVGLAVLAGSGNQVLKRADVASSPLVIGSFARLSPGPFRIRSDVPATYPMKCHTTIQSADIHRCDFGSRAAQKTIFLVGGSHSAHWLPALTEVAEARGWRIASVTKSGCAFAAPVDRALYESEQYHPSCATWNNKVMDLILRERPDLVISLATRPIFAEPGKREVSAVVGEQVPEGYVSHFRKLLAAGIGVLAIRDTPWMGFDVPACVFGRRDADEVRRCGHPRGRVLDDRGLARELLKLPAGLAHADMTDFICERDYCGTVRDGVVIYRDRHHLTATFARRLGPHLADRVEAALAKPAGLGRTGGAPGSSVGSGLPRAHVQ